MTQKFFDDVIVPRIMNLLINQGVHKLSVLRDVILHAKIHFLKDYKDYSLEWCEKNWFVE